MYITFVIGSIKKATEKQIQVLLEKENVLKKESEKIQQMLNCPNVRLKKLFIEKED